MSKPMPSSRTKKTRSPWRFSTPNSTFAGPLRYLKALAKRQWGGGEPVEPVAPVRAEALGLLLHEDRGVGDHRPQRGPHVVRDGVGEALHLVVFRNELLGPFGHARLQLGRQLVGGGDLAQVG